MQVITREEYLETVAGTEARKELQDMVNSVVYDTHDVYSATAGERQTFVERHLDYLAKHPATNLTVYVSNLRVMTKIKR